MNSIVELSYDIVGPTCQSAASDSTQSETEAVDTVVLLGSLGATREMWQAQVAHLSHSFRVIAVDLRGHGQSPAPAGAYSMELLADDVINILNATHTDSAHVVGLSLGGAVAQVLALDHSSRVKSLTLMSTAPKFGTSQAWLDKAELVSTSGTDALADTVVGNWFTDSLFAASPEIPAAYAENIRETSDAGYAGCCHALAEFDSRDRLATISLPTLVIAGEQDTSTALDVVQQLHAGIPGSTMVTISPAKHLVNVESAGFVNAVLQEFFAANA